jgi:hypothetical protein
MLKPDLIETNSFIVAPNPSTSTNLIWSNTSQGENPTWMNEYKLKYRKNLIWLYGLPLELKLPTESSS